MKRKKKTVKCAFLEYMWHVMVHCKHSRLAKALSDQSHSKRQRGHSPASHWMSFSLLSFGGASFSRRGRGRTAGRPCNEGEGSSCPLFLSIHKLVCFFFSLFQATVSILCYSLSILNVSSVAGSASTMSGSLSMCSPSRVSGSIFSSSRGN